jgi:hypothetical protein
MAVHFAGYTWEEAQVHTISGPGHGGKLQNMRRRFLHPYERFGHTQSKAKAHLAPHIACKQLTLKAGAVHRHHTKSYEYGPDFFFWHLTTSLREPETLGATRNWNYRCRVAKRDKANEHYWTWFHTFRMTKFGNCLCPFFDEHGKHTGNTRETQFQHTHADESSAHPPYKILAMKPHAHSRVDSNLKSPENLPSSSRFPTGTGSTSSRVIGE